MNRSELQIRIDELADDFLERRRDGENPSIAEFADANPDIATPLREFLRTILMVDDIKDGTEFPDSGLTDNGENGSTAEPFPNLDDYEIIREVGRGGMGIVYEAHQLSLDRTVALKVLPSGLFHNQDAVKRFQLEAKSAARLHHTNIVPIFDVNQTGQSCFYAMQFIEGQSLDFVVRELAKIVVDRSAIYNKSAAMSDNDLGTNNEGQSAHAVDLDQPVDSVQTAVLDRGAINDDRSTTNDSARSSAALSDTMKLGMSSTTAGWKPFYQNIARLGRQVADALHYAHENGVVHRDIKPANLMLDLAGAIWIMDFGLAKTDDSNLTQTGDVVGTLRYMSPERFAGQCDRRSDIYSLGMTMYELLAQKPAFEETNRLSLIDSIKTSEPESLRKVDRSIPRDLETIVEKAIDKEPKRRYATADDMASDLFRFINGQPIKARRVGNVERLWLWAKKRKALAASLAALSLLLVATAIGSSIAAYYFRDLAGQNLAFAKSNADKTMEAEQKAEVANKAKNAAETSQDRTNDVLGLVTGAFESVDPNFGADADILARDVLLQLEETLMASTLDDEGRLQLLDKLTRCYIAIGEEKSALSSAEDYFELAKSTLGEDDFQTAGARELLAQLHKQSGRIDEAISLFERNVEFVKNNPESEDGTIISAVGNLANAYYSAGRREESLALHEENVPFAKEALGDDSPVYLSALKARALCYQQLGRFDKAIPQFEEALEKCTSVLGQDHPDTLHAMDCLAVALNQNGQHEQAISLNEQTLELMQRKLGEDHGNTLNVMSNLVVAYNSVRRTAEAIALGERTIESIRTKFGETHPNNIGAMNALALAYKDAGRYAEAVELQVDLVSLVEASSGENHPGSLTARGTLASIYGKLERRTEELELREENLRRCKATFGEEHPSTVTGMQNLAGVYSAIGRTEEAIDMLETVLSLRRKIYGDGHVRVQSTMHSLAVSYQRNGQFPEAIEMMEQTRDLRVKSLGEDHPRTLSLMVGLASAYMDADRDDEGIPLMERTLELSRKKLGDAHPQTLITMHYLSGYFVKVERLEEAAELLAENLAAQKAINPEAWMVFNVESLYGKVWLDQGKLDEAEIALTNAYEGLRRITIPKGRERSVSTVIMRLKKLAETRGQSDVADKWQRMLETLDEPGD